MVANSQQMNQFSQRPIKGDIAAIINPSTLSVQFNPNSGTAYLVPGDYVKIVNVDGDQIVVDKCAAADVSFGCVLFNTKKERFYPSDTLEVAMAGSIVWCESSAAINRGVEVEFVATGAKVRTYAGTGNPTCGQALDKVTAGSELLRVLVRQLQTTAVDTDDITITGGSIDGTPIGADTPDSGAFTTLAASGVTTLSGNLILQGGSVAGAASTSVVVNKRVRCTISEVNAGKEILAAVSGKKWRLVNVTIIAIGGAVTSTTATGTKLTATQSASPATLLATDKAQLTQSAVNGISGTGATVLADGASFVQADVNTAVNFAANGGTDLAGASNIDVIISAVLES